MTLQNWMLIFFRNNTFRKTKSWKSPTRSSKKVTTTAGNRGIVGDFACEDKTLEIFRCFAFFFIVLYLCSLFFFGFLHFSTFSRFFFTFFIVFIFLIFLFFYISYICLHFFLFLSFSTFFIIFTIVLHFIFPLLFLLFLFPVVRTKAKTRKKSFRISYC